MTILKDLDVRRSLERSAFPGRTQERVNTMTPPHLRPLSNDGETMTTLPINAAHS